jgi:Protein of unknown function (DUF2878)
VSYKTTNFILYEVAWFACVLGAAHGRPWFGVCLAIMSMAVAGAISKIRRVDLCLIVFAGAIGFVMDSTLVLCGLLQFPAKASVGWPSPIWMVALWASFAMTLNGCLDWLKSRFGLASLLGAIGGPLAYAAGERMNALHLGPNRAVAFTAIAIEWALAMLALIWLDGAIAGQAPPINEATR